MSWLSNKTLIRKVKKNACAETLDAFNGIYSIDALPDFVPHRPFLIIVNTHTHNLPGEHWICILIDKDKNAELFDSLALPVSNILIRWLNLFSIKWKKNSQSFQHPLSSTCGAFVLFFVINRLHVKDFESLTDVFTSSPLLNEKTVENFYRALK